MHDGDKIGQSAVGGLVRTRNKTPINSFPEGQVLTKKAHALGTYFSYNKRHGKLISFRLQVKDQPELRIQVDLNTTRAAAQHGMLYFELLLNRLLRLYMSVQADAPKFNDDDWDATAEIEGILNIYKDLSLRTWQYLCNMSTCTMGHSADYQTSYSRAIESDFIPIIDMPNVPSKIIFCLALLYDAAIIALLIGTLTTTGVLNTTCFEMCFAFCIRAAKELA
jgi:hypothetical protein